MKEALVVLASVVSMLSAVSALPDRTRDLRGRRTTRGTGDVHGARRRRRSRLPSRNGRGDSHGDTALLLDLVAVGAMAGLSGPLSLSYAAGSIGGALSQRLGVALARAALAADPESVLLSMADAPGDAVLRDALREIHRSDGLGTPLAERLSDLARRERQRRGSEALARARTAPVRMLFPLVFLVLPAFALIAVAPLVLMTLGSVR